MKSNLTREDLEALAGSIERLGHRVERIEVSGPASRTVARLEAFGPDLIFNTAEGRRGRFREAFFPALFDELGRVDGRGGRGGRDGHRRVGPDVQRPRAGGVAELVGRVAAQAGAHPDDVAWTTGDRPSLFGAEETASAEAPPAWRPRRQWRQR